MQAYKDCYHEKSPTFSALAYDAVYLVKQAMRSIVSKKLLVNSKDCLLIESIKNPFT